MAQAADVFISYSREDKDAVLGLAAQLREAGVSLWIDQGSIDGAAMWGEEIVNALENAKVLILMVSEKSVNSHNVVKEVVLASERKEHILPVHLEPTRIPAGLKYPLAGIQHIEYFQGDKAENLKTIIRSLERIGVSIILPESPVFKPSQSSSHSMHSSKPEVEIERAIAVLPFNNMSPDKETDYFSDGLTEELITNLSRLKNIRVVPGTITMQFKGDQKNIRGIGEGLRARYVMTGSVRKHADNLRVTAQLIDVQTEAQLWAETYKGKVEDVFEIQEQVAKQIVEALSIELTTMQEVALTRRATDNVEAHDLYLRGRELLFLTNRRSVESAIQLFLKAIALDTRYSDAYAGLCEAYSALYELFDRKPEHLKHSSEAGYKAIMYDPNSAEAYAALGRVNFFSGNLPEAEEACLKSIEFNPNFAAAYRGLGRIYHLMDREDEALAAIKKAIELKPDDYGVMGTLDGMLRAAGQVDEANAINRKLVDFLPIHLLKNPDDSFARGHYAIALANAGFEEAARKEAHNAIVSDATDSVSLYNIACCLARLNDIGGAVESLRKAVGSGFEMFDWIKRDSDLDPIREHPGYIELMKGR